ncbi:MAG: hypothetical protein FJ288_09190 [Planctomycetes bacterium]|nr:hypothetical protein [Planctomycetota bacterium]
MIRFGGRRESFIGVDLEGRAVRAAQLRPAGRGWSLGAALVMPRAAADTPLQRAEVEALRGALLRQGFRGRRIVVAVPEDKLVTGVLELPPRSSGAPLDDIARTELANMHGYDLQAAEAVSWDLPQSSRRGTTQAMGVACRHADAEAVLAAFDGSGLQVQALDARLAAVARACGPVLSPDGITAVLDLEWTGAMLLLVHQATVFYKRTVSEGALKQLVKALMEGLGVDEDAVFLLLAEVGLAPRAAEHAAHAEAIAPAISKYLDSLVSALRTPLGYAVAQYPGAAVAGLLLVGHGAGIPGAAACLQERLEMDVRAVAPADLVQGPTSLAPKARDPALVAAVGLAEFADE